MLPNSAKTGLLYISSTTSQLRPGIDAVLAKAGLPAAIASNPADQDIWFQDTMEIGTTQIPGKPPMHVVMNAQRGNSADNVAPTLLAPNLGLITVGSPRSRARARTIPAVTRRSCSIPTGTTSRSSITGRRTGRRTRSRSCSEQREPLGSAALATSRSDAERA
jgi:hypothetical protein